MKTAGKLKSITEQWQSEENVKSVMAFRHLSWRFSLRRDAFFQTLSLPPFLCNGESYLWLQDGKFITIMLKITILENKKMRWDKKEQKRKKNGKIKFSQFVRERKEFCCYLQLNWEAKLPMRLEKLVEFLEWNFGQEFDKVCRRFCFPGRRRTNRMLQQQ